MSQGPISDERLGDLIAEVLRSSKGMSVGHVVAHLARDGCAAAPLDVTRVLRGSDRFRLRTPLGNEWILSPVVDAVPPAPGAFRDAMPDLYPWQRRAMESWADASRRGIVEAITGAGKTLLGVAAVRAAAGAGLRSLVIVPTTPLVEQWEQTLMRNLPGIRVAKVGGGSIDHGTALADVIVSTVHSAANRIPTADAAGRMLLVADEAHRYGAQSFRPIISAGFGWRLGLTATLQRRDGADAAFLMPEIGPVVHTLSYAAALDDGVVAPFGLRLIGVQIGVEDRDRYALLLARMEAIEEELGSILATGSEGGRSTVGAIRSLAGRGGRGSDLATEYLRILDEAGDLLDEVPEKMDALRQLAPTVRASRGCLVFTQTVKLAQAAAKSLRAEGVSLAVLTAEQGHEERSAALARFGSGAIEAIVAPRLLDEGIDVPDADLGVVVSAARSRRQMVQRMGRVIRPKPDGQRATFVVIFGRDTREDPANGAHSAFLEEVLPLARQVDRDDD